MPPSPCCRCGACCAFYTVAFASVECDPDSGGTVPVAFSVQIGHDRHAMRGTQKRFNKRCSALGGIIGVSVACRIYACRPTTCQQFAASWESGPPNGNCDHARAVYGLMPFNRF
ncbi:MAG: YkgJ family cysteine cluster protein [Desulfosarcinaceae bacterium]